MTIDELCEQEVLRQAVQEYRNCFVQEAIDWLDNCRDWAAWAGIDANQ